jgi:DNA-binding transcriptional MerR regulator
MTNNEPLVNLKAVVQQTGLKPDALRAWERRYGLPSSGRSGGRHRLYPERDIEVLCWLVARQREGLSISRAVDLWRKMEAGKGEPVAQQLPSSSITEPQLVGGMLDQLRREWLAACLAYDERRAEQAAAQAFALYPVETVCLELLQRALAEVGDLWQQGMATVQQEHLASELAIRQLESLHLEAALALGDMTLLDADITSMERRLAHEGLPAGVLGRYLSAYCQVAEKELDERGELILAWLRRVAGR